MNRGKDKIEYAIYYATKAHKGQTRKVENVDMIFHPFTVGMILQRNACDEDIVTAGILHGILNEMPNERIVEFGTCASSLKHSIIGDINIIDEDTINSVIDNGLCNVKR